MLTIDDLRLEQGAFTLSADITLPEHGLIAVIGPSGAGKSTFLGAIAGFTPLSTGEIRWGVQRIDTLPVADRPVSMLFQAHNLFPHLTAEQNVGLALSPKLRLKKEQKREIRLMLDALNLQGQYTKRPGELSGGQQSRVALARVLLQDRPIVLLDEPFSALGPAMREAFLQLVSERLAGKLVLMVTHSPAEAVKHVSSAIVIANGKVSAPVAMEALMQTPPEELANYLA